MRDSRPACQLQTQYRGLNCFDDFVGAAGGISAARTYDDDVIFAGGSFAQNLRDRFPQLNNDGAFGRWRAAECQSSLIKPPAEAVVRRSDFPRCQDSDLRLGLRRPINRRAARRCQRLECRRCKSGCS